MKKHPLRSGPRGAATSLSSRRTFLRRALLIAAYAAPVVASYPRTVFAAHCQGSTTWQREFNCGGSDHMLFWVTWSPGCSRVN